MPPWNSDLIRSDGGRTISIIRHGATDYNNERVSVDRIRGWRDIPLNETGKAEAEKLAGKLARDPPDTIVTSDLKRAHDTAKIISDRIGLPISDVSEGFRPWNVGEYSGMIAKTAVPLLSDYACNRPDEKVPGGESFNNFRDRFFTAMKEAMDKYPGDIGIVSHHRNERLMAAWAANGYPEDYSIKRSVFEKKGEAPGNVMTLHVPMLEAKMDQAESAA